MTPELPILDGYKKDTSILFNVDMYLNECRRWLTSKNYRLADYEWYAARALLNLLVDNNQAKQRRELLTEYALELANHGY